MQGDDASVCSGPGELGLAPRFGIASSENIQKNLRISIYVLDVLK